MVLKPFHFLDNPQNGENACEGDFLNYPAGQSSRRSLASSLKITATVLLPCQRDDWFKFPIAATRTRMAQSSHNALEIWTTPVYNRVTVMQL